MAWTIFMTDERLPKCTAAGDLPSSYLPTLNLKNSCTLALLTSIAYFYADLTKKD